MKAKSLFMCMMLAMPLGFTACNNDDEPKVQEQVVSENDILSFLEESEFVAGHQMPLKKVGNQWEYGLPKITFEGLNYLDFWKSITNQYFWYREGQLYIDVPFLTYFREKEVSRWEDIAFSYYMNHHYNGAFYCFIPVTLKYDETTREITTAEKAFDLEEVPGMKFILEDFIFNTLTIRTEYDEQYGGNDGSHSSYKQTTPPETGKYMIFKNKQEVYDFLDKVLEDAKTYAKENYLFPDTD